MGKCSVFSAILIAGLMLVITPIAYSSGFEDAVNIAKNDAQNKKTDSFRQAKNFNPQSFFDNYTKNPDQTKYYKDVTDANTQQMTNDVLQSKNGESGTDISNAIHQHPRFVINKSDPDMQHSKLIQNEADNIIRGVTSRYIDCKPKEACTSQYQQKQCEEAAQAIFQSCKRKLSVEIIPHQTVTHYPLQAHLSVKEHNYAGVSINSVNGRVDFLGPHDASFRLDGRLPANIDCHTLIGSLVSRQGRSKLDHINFPSCSDGLNLDFHISGGHGIILQIDMASKVVTYEVKDNWIDDCAGIKSDITCKLKSTQCDIPTSTQVIQGMPVTRDCWQHSFNYICRGGSGEGNCKPLQSQGCEQIGSKCANEENGRCLSYLQTYRCPIQICSPTTDVICGNGKDYCLDGNCVDHSYEQSKDFGKAVSSLSAVADAAKNLDQSSLTIFTGHTSECSEKPIGYSNCCTETGWGQDIGLDNCPEAAKKLHVDRENKLAIKVGRYCSGPEPFPCIEHSQVFCVFNSKLAKIIQEQGRAGQLRINFGSAKEPNCRGISPEELQAINFARLDFKDFIADLQKNVKTPDIKQIQNMIQQHVQERKTTGQANG